MDVPLNIVQGKDGSFQDVYGRPMVMVFNLAGKARPCGRKEGDLADQSVDTRTRSQPLAFISNDFKTKERDKTARYLIRSHVMKNYKRQEKIAHTGRKLRTQSLRQKRLGLDYDYIKVLKIPTQPSGSLDPFVSYPVPMHSHMYKLVHHYFSVMIHVVYPREPDLFQMAMSDAALFHMILCNSALYTDVLNGKTESHESVLHKLEAIAQIKLGLQASPVVSDALIGAVACLAKAESVLGNYEMWEIHRNGLIQMVEIRGGIKMLNGYLQAKVYITDLVGCLEADASPNFPFFDGSDPQPLASYLSLWSLSGFKNIEAHLSFDSELVDVISDLSAFTEMVVLANTTKGSHEIDHFAAKLRHRLLSCPSARKMTTPGELILELCRIGGLLYLRTILRAFPSRRRDPHILIQKLIHCICNLSEFIAIDRHVSDLVLWLLFVGTVADSSGSSKRWFSSKISELSFELGLSNWDGLKAILMKFLWAKSMHEIPFQNLWNEVLLTNEGLLQTHFVA